MRNKKTKIGFMVLLLLLLLGGSVITAVPHRKCSPCTNIFDDSLEPPYQVKCQFTGVGTCPEWWEEFDAPPVPNGEIFTLKQTTYCTWELIIPPPPNAPYHGWHILWNPYKHILGLICFGPSGESSHYIECPIGPHQEFEDECWMEFSDNCMLCEDLTPLGGSGKVWWVDDFYGDFNFDGIVDGKDLALFAEKWHWSILDDNYDLMYDATQDGWTNEKDLAVLVSNWLKERPE